MKSETDTIDDQIQSLEKYKQQWSKVVSDYDKGINKQIAAMVLGKDWESKVLNQRLDILNAFKDQYISIQDAMQQSALETAKITAEASNPTTSTNPTTPTDGSNTGSFMEERAKTVHLYNGKEYSTSNEAAAARAKDAKKAYDDEIKRLSNASGMPTSAKEASANQKKQEILKRPITVKKYAKGGIIGSADKDDILTSLAKSVGEDSMVAVQKGEGILDASLTKDFLKLVNLSEKLVPVLDTNFASNMFNSEFSKLLALVGTGGTQTVNNTFNVSLPNIHDGSKAIDLFNELQNLSVKGVQYFNGKK